MGPNAITLSYDDFKFYLGETIEYCQTIEHDVKWIYAVMLEGDCNETFDEISKLTLGQVLSRLEKLDFSDSKNYLTSSDYELLKRIADERNYLVHQIYRDFLYVNDFLNSRQYQVASSRLMNFHNRLEKLQKNVENARLKAVQIYRGS